MLKARLQAIKDGEKASALTKLMWKPKEGTQKVRIIPYKFNPESPFIELKFYYKLAGGNYLAPCTFGKADPIYETAEKLRSSGDAADREIAKKLTATERTYVPVIVRGEEHLGVKFWGFGKQVFTQLLTLTSNEEEYGDITSLTNGNDINVEFHKVSSKMINGSPIPETLISPSLKSTPAVDPKNAELIKMLDNQTDILTIFPLKTYDELAAVLEKYLNPDGVQPTTDIATDVANDAVPVADAPASEPATEVAEKFDSFFAKPTE